MIEVQDLTKTYSGRSAVSDLTFSVQPGEVTGFVGPNGSGKSTTMRMMVGLAKPNHGTVRINGKPFHASPAPLADVGALLELKAAHPGHTARAHLRGLAYSNGISRERVDQVLELVGLTDVANRRTRTFSLGMHQRLGIAAALLGDPQVLILDEPFNGLDPQGIRWLRDLLTSQAREGKTVLVSSHFIGELATTATRVVVIGSGRLITVASVSELTQGGADTSASLEDAVVRLTGDVQEFRAIDPASIPRPENGDAK